MNDNYETMSNGSHEVDETLSPLESVGCVLVTEGKGIGMTYPMYVDGTHDEGMGVHLDDIDEDDDWFYSLNSEDNSVVQDVLFELHPNRLESK